MRARQRVTFPASLAVSQDARKARDDPRVAHPTLPLSPWSFWASRLALLTNQRPRIDTLIRGRANDARTSPCSRRRGLGAGAHGNSAANALIRSPAVLRDPRIRPRATPPAPISCRSTGRPFGSRRGVRFGSRRSTTARTSANRTSSRRRRGFRAAASSASTSAIDWHAQERPLRNAGRPSRRPTSSVHA